MAIKVAPKSPSLKDYIFLVVFNVSSSRKIISILGL